MTNQKSTKRALITSVLALLVCISMLIGSTFAWFTDTVTSGSNTIVSGNLDIVLEMKDADGNWVDAEGKVIPFNAKDGRTEILWEPGCTYNMADIRVRNVGNLTAYVLVRISGIDGNAKLLEAIEFSTGVSELEPANERALIRRGMDSGELDGKATIDPISGTEYGTLLWDECLMPEGEIAPNNGLNDTSATISVSGHMKEEAGNEYQGLSISGISITVLATQCQYERDSFGSNYDADAELPAIEETVSVTPENLATVDFTQNDATFVLAGEFSNDVSFSVASGLNQVYDASSATFAEGATVTFNAPGVAHSYSTLSAERNGNVTVKGFKTGTLNILAYNNESVTVSDNKVGAMSIIGGNFDLTISGNTVDGNFQKYTDGEGQGNEYGISLRITDYELSFLNNVITDTYSHSVGINGRQGEAASDWGNCGANNKIKAFSGNKITVNTTYKNERAALKIWCDQAYAPYATSGQNPNANATALMTAILADSTNVFTLGEGHTTFNIFDYKQ